jgi:hypothetical protein
MHNNNDKDYGLFTVCSSIMEKENAAVRDKCASTAMILVIVFIIPDSIPPMTDR